jgi:hypothetical protein
MATRSWLKIAKENNDFKKVGFLRGELHMIQSLESEISKDMQNENCWLNYASEIKSQKSTIG